jgi:probable H4MPT-linked C1 transfer pathway protein
MKPDPLVTIGWDVGGVQVKAARVESRPGHPRVIRTAVRALEIWRRRDQLPDILRDLAGELSVDSADAHALTMTAELSDAFRDKREGVLFVMNGIGEALPRSAVFALDSDGVFVPLPAARTRPLGFAATNWIASALYAAPRIGEGILVDVGSTTTDIIPIRKGSLACEGRTDLDRLVAGELVYSGVLRTNPNTLTGTVPVRGRPCRLAAEQFAVMADVYLILGLIEAEHYACPTPDGRAVSPAASRERLARLVCADREMLSEGEIVGIARYLRERHLQVIGEGLLQVLSRWEGHSAITMAPCGAGAFLASAVADRLGLDALPPAELWGDASVTLPAAAAACLLASRLERLPERGGGTGPRDTQL